MSRYDELTELAANYSRKFFEHRTQCQRFANRIVKGYAEFLGCPIERIQGVGLDAGLKPTNQMFPFGEDLPLTVDREGFWYFCWRISFDSDGGAYCAHEMLMFGLSYKDGKVLIREDRNFIVDPSDPLSAEPFFSYLFATSRSGFSSPHGSSSKRIGFVYD